ncbi:hypothetical protein F4821DRAFT_147189 [Hypoxylon rubiginosum]|uniref:Uncharacterized protein n=1 Tax=Hypoxylon rubiginosum TaxID=110542 RepID=A0ACC0CYS7_9PEZI|nr:hypothetical protein F4821DRAFT_147189 [Hypoxylon rubiginosum]
MAPPQSDLNIEQPSPAFHIFCLIVPRARNGLAMPGCCRKKVPGPRKKSKMECVVPGCTDRRHGSGSDFCKNHPCEHYYLPERCASRKAATDSFCRIHMRCPQPGCNKAKIQYADGRRERFCGDHKCSESTCSNLRNLQQNQYHPYCNDHACRVANCQERTLAQPGIVFIYCQRHKCSLSNCGSPAVNPPGPCRTHNQCRRPNCSNQRERNQDDCFEHRRCETNDCNELKKPGSSHCDRHTCLERDCENPSDNYGFCNIHRCENAGCRERQGMGGSRFCGLRKFTLTLYR